MQTHAPINSRKEEIKACRAYLVKDRRWQIETHCREIGFGKARRSKVWEQFRVLRDQGRTLFVTTQYVGEASYCDYVGVMRAGRLLHVDTPDALRKRALGGDVIELVVDPPHALEVLQLLPRQHRVQVFNNRGEQGSARLGEERAQIRSADAEPKVGRVIKGLVHIVDPIAVAGTLVER